MPPILKKNYIYLPYPGYRGQQAHQTGKLLVGYNSRRPRQVSQGQESEHIMDRLTELFFSTLQLSSFSKPLVMMASNSCSSLTIMKPGMILYCCSTYTLSFDAHTGLLFSSPQLYKVLFKITDFPFSSSLSRHSPLT